MIFDIKDFEVELSELLAKATQEWGTGRCYERAKAALELCDPALGFRYVEGLLHADQGMEPDGFGDHAWLMTPQGTVVDPSVASVFLSDGFITGLVWELGGVDNP